MVNGAAFPSKPLQGLNFQKNRTAEQLTWTSANHDTTAEFCRTLDLVLKDQYSCVTNQSGVDTITIEGRKNLKEFVAAGGRFPGSIHYEDFSSLRKS